ncbi:MAG: hypothetical protein WC412_02080 [Candidatus Omnitrophota bacterium]|jgi:hypothetical protein
MKVLIAAVSEHAWVENGCLSLCRTFDGVSANKFPYTLPRMSVALRLSIGRSEVGEHKVNISLVDSDGKKLMDGNININFQPPKDSAPESSSSFALNGQNIIFPKPGDYVVNILVDGKLESSVPIYVREGKSRGNADMPDSI